MTRNQFGGLVFMNKKKLLIFLSLSLQNLKFANLYFCAAKSLSFEKKYKFVQLYLLGYETSWFKAQIKQLSRNQELPENEGPKSKKVSKCEGIMHTNSKQSII